MSSPYACGALHDVTPYLMCRDAGGGIAFCIAAFGAAERMRHVDADGGRIAHALAQGARLVYAVADRDHGRSGSVRDPYGYHCTSRRRRGLPHEQ